MPSCRTSCVTHWFLAAITCLGLFFSSPLRVAANEVVPQPVDEHPEPEAGEAEKAEPSVSQGFAERIRALDEAGDTTLAMWEELSLELEAALPEVATRQQQLRLEMRETRRQGRDHETVQALLKQREEIEEAIQVTLDNLPAVVELRDQFDHMHSDLLSISRLRVDVQRRIGQFSELSEEPAPSPE